MKKNHENNKENNQSRNEETNQPNNDEINNERTEKNLLEKEEEILVKIGQMDNEITDLKDKLLRKAAEFENYKRRTENDQINLLKYAAEPFIVKLLPVVDDLERSIEHMDSAKEIEPIKKGILLIYDKLMKILNDQGVKKIDAAGKPFDVEFHEALMQRRADNVEPHMVIDEVEKGYMYKDKVIRHSKVIVSEDLAGNPASNDQQNDDNLNR